MCENFYNDRLKNDRALVLWKSDNDPKKKHNNNVGSAWWHWVHLVGNFKNTHAQTVFRLVELYTRDGRVDVELYSSSTHWRRVKCEPAVVFDQLTCRKHLQQLMFFNTNIGVWDGGRGMCPPSPQKKNRKKYFSGNYCVKFGHFAQKSCKI